MENSDARQVICQNSVRPTREGIRFRPFQRLSTADSGNRLKPYFGRKAANLDSGP